MTRARIGVVAAGLLTVVMLPQTANAAVRVRPKAAPPAQVSTLRD